MEMTRKDGGDRRGGQERIIDRVCGVLSRTVLLVVVVAEKDDRTRLRGRRSAQSVSQRSGLSMSIKSRGGRLYIPAAVKSQTNERERVRLLAVAVAVPANTQSPGRQAGREPRRCRRCAED